MYHQFKELAGIDITTEAMEIGPTTHYVMGGIRVEAESQMSSVPGLFAAGECGAGLHGANRLGGNSLSDLLVFGKRAGEYAAEYAKKTGAVKIDTTKVDAAAKWAAGFFDRDVSPAPASQKQTSSRAGAQDNAFVIQHDLQTMMQELVGIVRTESEIEQALPALEQLRERAERVSVSGNREYNPGWHTAMDLRNLLSISESIARSALLRKESRGGHFRSDYPEKDSEQAKVNTIIRKKGNELQITQEPLVPMTAEHKAIIEEMK
jgi:succinate dehydrogenase / fumarate reductase flavoprotein subunit